MEGPSTGKVYKRLQLIGGKVGVDDCRPHRSRDSCAVRWLEKGMGIEVVSQLLGHSKIEITWNHYSGALNDKEKRAETAYLKLVAGA
jgi:integrase